MIAVVPNELHDAINRKLDVALVGHETISPTERADLYQVILEYYDEHGELPEFAVIKRDE